MAKLNEIKDDVILKEGYYLDNFLSLIDFIFDMYKDMLSEVELSFIFNFKKLSVNSQRLYVRLISRKGPYFREDKIKYPEIPNLKDCLNELCDQSFFIFGPRHEIEFALQIITKPELLELIKDKQSRLIPTEDNLTGKSQIIDYFLLQDPNIVWELLEERYIFYFPCYYEIVLMFRLLFFGNTYQDLSEFILEDIGVLRYETYEIRKIDRLFSERKVADDILFISQLRTELWPAIQNNELDTVLYIGKQMRSFDCHTKAKRKLEKSYTEIGRFLEKFKLWDEALVYYNLSAFPPAAERKTRVLEKKGSYKEALVCTEKILQHSSDEEEIEFAGKFAEQIKKKLDLPYKKRSRESFKTENLVLEFKQGIRVEEISLNHFKQNKREGFYSENGIWKAMFGLAFWDIIFMPVPEVFFNPFQRGPVDLFSSEFRKKREDAIKKSFNEIHDEKWPEKIVQMYESKYNVANMLVSWKRISIEQIISVLKIVPRHHIIAIFERMSLNLRDLKTGFPDLMIFDPIKKDYCFVEVKGPGDQLRLNQKRWFRYFDIHGIPYKVANINWK